MKRLFSILVFTVMALMARGQLMTPSGASTISNRGAFFLGFRVPQVASLPVKPDLLNYTGDSATGSVVFCLCAANPSQRGFYGWSTNQWLKLSTSADGGVQVAFKEVGVGGPDGKLAGYSTLTYDSASGQLWIKNTPTPGTYQLIVEGVSNFAATVTSQAAVLGAFTMPNEIISSPQTDTTDNKPMAINLITGEVHRMRNWPTGTQASGLVNGFYTFSSILTASDPGGGRLRLNNVNYSAVTQIYISELSQNGTDASAYMNAMRAGDVFYVQDKDDASRYSRYTITGTTTDNGAWRTIPVTFVSSAGSLFANNGNLALQVNFTGGSTSAAAWEISGNAGTTAANFVGTTDSKPLSFRTKNSERMVIDTFGRVLINPNNDGIIGVLALNGATNPLQNTYVPVIRAQLPSSGGFHPVISMHNIGDDRTAGFSFYDFNNRQRGGLYYNGKNMSINSGFGGSSLQLRSDSNLTRILLGGGFNSATGAIIIDATNGNMTTPGFFILNGGGNEFVRFNNATTGNNGYLDFDNSGTTVGRIGYAGGQSFPSTGSFKFAKQSGLPFIFTNSATGAEFDNSNIIGGFNETSNTLFVGVKPTVDPAVGLHVNYTNKGFLIQPSTAAQWAGIASKPTGLQAYDSDKKQPVFYDGTTTSYMAKVVIGSAAPASTPDAVGQIFIDTVGKKVYMSTGTASSADWTILN